MVSSFLSAPDAILFTAWLCVFLGITMSMLGKAFGFQITSEHLGTGTP
jgi:hypothetical protein